MRRSLDLTQAEFASRIGSTQNAVTGYETGRRNPSSSVVNNICKEFHINEKWLRTGEGEMFREMSRDDEIAAFVGDILRDETDSFRKRVISMLSRLDVSDWEVLERMAAGMVQKPAADQRDSPPWTEEQHAIWEAEARAEAEEVYRQVLEEKRAEAGLSASPPGGGVA